jgi:hypothetical protein
MIAARAEKGGRVTDAVRHGKPEHTCVEGEGAFEIRDFQMYVPDLSARIDLSVHN